MRNSNYMKSHTGGSGNFEGALWCPACESIQQMLFEDIRTKLRCSRCMNRFPATEVHKVQASLKAQFEAKVLVVHSTRAEILSLLKEDL